MATKVSYAKPMIEPSPLIKKVDSKPSETNSEPSDRSLYENQNPDVSETLTNIFDAMSVIIDNKLNKIGYNRTIVCTITNDKDSDYGQYEVSDGNTTFFAYSDNREYKEQDSVYVTIPNNNFDQQKIIIGKVGSTDKNDKEPLSSAFKAGTIPGEIVGNKNAMFLGTVEKIEEKELSTDKGEYFANQFEEDVEALDVLNYEKGIWYKRTKPEYYEIIPNSSQTELLIWTLNKSPNIPNFYNAIKITADFKVFLETKHRDIFKGTFGLRLDIVASRDLKDQKYYSLYFDNSFMFGDYYRNGIFKTQEAYFDVSNLLTQGYNIDKMQLVLFQDNNFSCFNGTTGKIERCILNPEQNYIRVKNFDIILGQNENNYETVEINGERKAIAAYIYSLEEKYYENNVENVDKKISLYTSLPEDISNYRVIPQSSFGGTEWVNIPESEYTINGKEYSFGLNTTKAQNNFKFILENQIVTDALNEALVEYNDVITDIIEELQGTKSTTQDEEIISQIEEIISQIDEYNFEEDRKILSFDELKIKYPELIGIKEFFSSIGRDIDEDSILNTYALIKEYPVYKDLYENFESYINEIEDEDIFLDYSDEQEAEDLINKLFPNNNEDIKRTRKDMLLRSYEELFIDLKNSLKELIINETPIDVDTLKALVASKVTTDIYEKYFRYGFRDAFIPFNTESKNFNNLSLFEEYVGYLNSELESEDDKHFVFNNEYSTFIDENDYELRTLVEEELTDVVYNVNDLDLSTDEDAEDIEKHLQDGSYIESYANNEEVKYLTDEDIYILAQDVLKAYLLDMRNSIIETYFSSGELFILNMEAFDSFIIAINSNIKYEEKPEDRVEDTSEVSSDGAIEVSAASEEEVQKMIEEAKQKEDEAKAKYEKARQEILTKLGPQTFETNILTFYNVKGEDASETKSVAAVAIASAQGDTFSNYNVDGTIANPADADKLREVHLSSISSLGKTIDISSVTTVTWLIPSQNTMIQTPENGIEYNSETDVVVPDGNFFYIKRPNTATSLDKISQNYRIKGQYIPSATNNTIYCQFVLDGEMISIPYKINFSTMSNGGVGENTLYLRFSDGNNALTIGDTISVEPIVLDKNGNDITNTFNADQFEFSWESGKKIKFDNLNEYDYLLSFNVIDINDEEEDDFYNSLLKQQEQGEVSKEVATVEINSTTLNLNTSGITDTQEILEEEEEEESEEPIEIENEDELEDLDSEMVESINNPSTQASPEYFYGTECEIGLSMKLMEEAAMGGEDEIDVIRKYATIENCKYYILKCVLKNGSFLSQSTEQGEQKDVDINETISIPKTITSKIDEDERTIKIEKYTDDYNGSKAYYQTITILNKNGELDKTSFPTEDDESSNTLVVTHYNGTLVENPFRIISSLDKQEIYLDGRVNKDEDFDESLLDFEEIDYLDTTSTAQKEITLVSYISIPVKLNDSILSYSGPTNVLYDTSGINPSYYNGPAELTYIDAATHKEKTNVGVTWDIGLGDDTGVGEAAKKYYPSINSESGILSPVVMYMQENGKQVSVDAYLNGTLVWSQPLRIEQNAFGLPLINSWDGSLTLDENNGTILSTMIGAGKKDEENRFYGVLMGDVSVAGEDTSAGAGDGTDLRDYYQGIGLYGYSEGYKSFGFNINGRAFLGRSGRGQILFDGNNGVIQSANFLVNNVGMSIDLDDGILTSLGPGVEGPDGKLHQAAIQINPQPFSENEKDSKGNPITDKYGLGRGYFTIRSTIGHNLFFVGDKDYYLQTDNFNSDSYISSGYYIPSDEYELIKNTNDNSVSYLLKKKSKDEENEESKEIETFLLTHTSVTDIDDKDNVTTTTEYFIYLKSDKSDPKQTFSSPYNYLDSDGNTICSFTWNSEKGNNFNGSVNTQRVMRSGYFEHGGESLAGTKIDLMTGEITSYDFSISAQHPVDENLLRLGIIKDSKDPSKIDDKVFQIKSKDGSNLFSVGWNGNIVGQNLSLTGNISGAKTISCSTLKCTNLYVNNRKYQYRRVFVATSSGGKTKAERHGLFML